MVDALRNLHEALRPGGVLLDVHAEPDNSLLEVWQPGRVHRLGEIEQDQDAADIRAARTRLVEVEREGLFTRRREEIFEMLGHYEAVDEWLGRWRAEGWNFSVAAPALDRARELMSTAGRELIIREAVRATALTRSDGTSGT